MTDCPSRCSLTGRAGGLSSRRRACSGGEAVQSAPAGRAAGGARRVRAVPVTTARGRRKNRCRSTLGVIGTVEAYSTVAGARADHRRADVGATSRKATTSRKGQVLFTLDRRPLEAALRAGAGQPRSATRRRRRTRKSQAQRYQDLADARHRDQASRSTRRRPAAAALEATVGADRAAVENAKVQLQYATIAAPISGRTGALMVHEGNLVRANDATPLVVINQVAPIYVVVRHSRSAAAGAEALPGAGRRCGSKRCRPTTTAPPSGGRITFVDNAVDQTTGTIRIKGTFPNDDRRLWPGQFVNVSVTLTDRSDARSSCRRPRCRPGQQGQYVVRRQAGSDGGAADRRGRARRSAPRR